MGSTIASRIYWAHKEGGRELPRFSDDDYIDFCVLEALTVRGGEDRRKAEKKKKMEEWKKGAKDLLPSRSGSKRN